MLKIIYSLCVLQEAKLNVAQCRFCPKSKILIFRYHLDDSAICFTKSKNNVTFVLISVF